MLLLPRIRSQLRKASLFEWHKTDLQLAMQLQALWDSALFARKHLFHVRSYRRPRKVLLEACAHAKVQPGELVCEFGVFSGRSTNLIAKSFPDSAVYGFDSFEGLPEDWRGNLIKGTFALKHLPRVRSNVTLVKGWFDQTLPDFLATHQGTAAFLHIDCDLYSSTRTVLSLFADRVRPGTILLFDEYFNYSGWEDGEYKAFQEFIAATGYSFRYLVYCNQAEQVAVQLGEKHPSGD
jgi:predicted O-methyltransferase YrrM